MGKARGMGQAEKWDRLRMAQARGMGMVRGMGQAEDWDMQEGWGRHEV
jgi:hypothetical protein